MSGKKVNSDAISSLSDDELKFINHTRSKLVYEDDYEPVLKSVRVRPPIKTLIGVTILTFIALLLVFVFYNGLKDYVTTFQSGSLVEQGFISRQDYDRTMMVWNAKNWIMLGTIGVGAGLDILLLVQYQIRLMFYKYRLKKH